MGQGRCDGNIYVSDAGAGGNQFAPVPAQAVKNIVNTSNTESLMCRNACRTKGKAGNCKRPHPNSDTT